MRRKVLGIALLLALTAGCIGATDTQQDLDQTSTADQEDLQEEEEITEVIVYQAEVEGPQVGGDRLDVSFPAQLGEGLTDLELELSWAEQTNGFGVDVEMPGGTTHEIDPPDEATATRVKGTVPAPSPGAYEFHLTASNGVVAQDEVRLEAQATFLVQAAETADVGADGTVRGPVNVEETQDGYRAWVTYRANATASESMTVSADTVNGQIQHQGTASQATGTVTAWAHGDSPDEARNRLDEITVRLVVDPDGIDADVSAPDWEQRGADMATGVPESTTARGDFDTTNGPIQFEEARVNGLSASTTNGGIQGDVTGDGDFEFGTTNGPIDVALTPTASSSLAASTTNGGINLALAENPETGYRIDASTTNGQITEQMEEASLSGDDEDATLRTDGYSDRSIQLSGTTSTTNGNIHFEGR